MSNNRVHDNLALEIIENIVNNKCESLKISHKFNIKFKSKNQSKLTDILMNDIIFICIYNYCVEIRLLNEMDDKEMGILFIELLIMVLNQKDIIPSNLRSNRTQFYSSCARLLAYFQNEVNHNMPTDIQQLLESMQKLLETDANLLPMPPPIIPELMNISKINQKCNDHYGQIISDMILKMEIKENMNDDECISKSNDCVYIIEIICGYHHDKLIFWTVYPSQPSLTSPDYGNEDSSEFDVIDKDEESTEKEFTLLSTLDPAEDSIESFSDIDRSKQGISLYDDIRAEYEYELPPPFNLNSGAMDYCVYKEDQVRVSVVNEKGYELEPSYDELIIVTPRDDDRDQDHDPNGYRSRKGSLSNSASTVITRSPPSRSVGFSDTIHHSFLNSTDSPSFSSEISKLKVTFPTFNDIISPPMHSLSPPSNIYTNHNIKNMHIKNLEMNIQSTNELVVNASRMQFNSSGSNNNDGRDKNRGNNNHRKSSTNDDDEKKIPPEKEKAKSTLDPNAKAYTPNQPLTSIDENAPIPSANQRCAIPSLITNNSINSSSSSDETGLCGDTAVLVPANVNISPPNPEHEKKNNYENKPIISCKLQFQRNISHSNHQYIKDGKRKNHGPRPYVPRNRQSYATYQSSTDNDINDEHKTNFTMNRNMTSSKKKSRKSTRSTYLSKLNGNNSYSYEPHEDIRIESTVWVPKEFTKTIIPSAIDETFTDLYAYIDKSTAMQDQFQCKCDNGKIRIFNYDLHHKGEIIYFVAQSQIKRRGYTWRLLNRLFTKQTIMESYKIAAHDLPQSSRINDEFGKIEQIKKQIIEQHATLCAITRWNKVPVHNNESSSQERMTFSITPQKFEQAIKNCIESQHAQIELVPIVMFYDCKSNQTGYGGCNKCKEYREYKLCFIHIVAIKDNINIGISYIYNQNKQCIEINGIHLRKDKIQEHHELANVTGCAENCRCLDSFVSSNIDMLHIGNPDDAQNKINALRQEKKRLQNELSRHKSQNVNYNNRQYPQNIYDGSDNNESISNFPSETSKNCNHNQTKKHQ